MADAAAQREGQAAVEESLVEVQVFAGFLMGDGELAEQRIAVYADAHAGEFEGVLEDGVPDEDVAVEAAVAVVGGGAPVVVVRGAAVMGLSGARERAADADEEDGAVLFADFVLALLRGEIRVLCLEVLGEVEMDLLGEERDELRVVGGEGGLGAADGVVDAADRLLEERDGAVLVGDDLFPVPLVDVEGVEIVELLVGADGLSPIPSFISFT